MGVFPHDGCSMAPRIRGSNVTRTFVPRETLVSRPWAKDGPLAGRTSMQRDVSVVAPLMCVDVAVEIQPTVPKPFDGPPRGLLGPGETPESPRDFAHDGQLDHDPVARILPALPHVWFGGGPIDSQLEWLHIRYKGRVVSMCQLFLRCPQRDSNSRPPDLESGCSDLLSYGSWWWGRHFNLPHHGPVWGVRTPGGFHRCTGFVHTTRRLL